MKIEDWKIVFSVDSLGEQYPMLFGKVANLNNTTITTARITQIDFEKKIATSIFGDVYELGKCDVEYFL